MRRKILFVFIFTIGFFVASCQSSSEPTDENTLSYNPSQNEVIQQTEELVTNVLDQTTNILAGYRTMNETTNLNKVSDEGSLYDGFLDGWHVWRGDIRSNPFGIEGAYNADYLGKIQFKDNTDKTVESPQDADRIRTYLNSHAAFGFVEDQPYGDEVWYNFDGDISQLDGNPSVIGLFGKYERRWFGLYNDVETEIHYNVWLDFDNLQLYYSGQNNDFTLFGDAIAYFNPDEPSANVTNANIIIKADYKIVINFDNSRIGKAKVYDNDNNVVNEFDHYIPNYYEIYNLPSIENWQMGVNFKFPAPIPL